METTVVVEFKAGKMALIDGRLVPDTRKGLIRVCQDEAGLVHFCWFARDAAGDTAGDADTDIVILPGDASFSKIPRPGARVFELRFPEEGHRNLFFWAQEADAAGDDDYVATINFALNQPGGDDDAAAMEADAPAPAPTPPAAPAAPAPSLGAISGADLASVLGSILSGKGGGAAPAATQRRVLDAGPSLGDVLRPELVVPLLQQPGMAERLAPYLPEEHRSVAAISELVSTPQFRHQLDLFSHALMTGQLDTSQFGLAPGGFGVADFLRSIQARADERQHGEQQERQGGGHAAPQ